MQNFFKQLWQMILDSNLLNVVGAIAILVIGWLIALVTSRKISAVILKLSAKKTVLPDGFFAVYLSEERIFRYPYRRCVLCPYQMQA